MKFIPVTILTLALGTIPAWATAQQQQDPQQQQQQPGQEQQAEQQQQQKFLSEARIDGKVRQLQDDSVTIGVAGTEIELKADKQQLEGLSEGDVVETTAIPLPEAQQVTPMAEVDQQQRQQLEQQQQQQPLEAVVPGEGMDQVDEAQIPGRGTDHDERDARTPGDQTEQQDQDQEALLPGQEQDQQQQQDNNDNGEAEAVLPGQGEYVLSGTVTQVQDNIVQFETEQHGELSLQMDAQQAQELEQGQEYMIQLSELPDEAKQWKARDIQQL